TRSRAMSSGGGWGFGPGRRPSGHTSSASPASGEHIKLWGPTRQTAAGKGRTRGRSFSMARTKKIAGLPAARAPLLGAPVRYCPAPGCSCELTGQQRACSGRCRAALSRQRKAAVRQARIREIRDLLITGEEKIEAARCRLLSLESR